MIVDERFVAKAHNEKRSLLPYSRDFVQVVFRRLTRFPPKVAATSQSLAKP
jgi:hypothetical protein